LLLGGCRAAAPPAPPPPLAEVAKPCAALFAADHVGGLCGDAEMEALWVRLNGLETEATAPERQAFNGNIQTCLTPGKPADAAAQACIKRRLWARLTALAKAVDPAALTGRYLVDGSTLQGEARILEDGAGYAQVRLETQNARAGQLCVLSVKAWRSQNELAWQGELQPGDMSSICDLSMRRIGRDLIVASDTRCTLACGPEVDYAVRYRLQP
jgi:hypothetical protein